MAKGRATRSAGLLAYRRSSGGIEVFLVHPGGPFWRHRDAGAWSIPKGELRPDEAPLSAARREFREETGLEAGGSPRALPPVRQAGGKWVVAWAVEAPGLDPAALRSNTFQLEWPPRSGALQAFPEIDRAGWFPLPHARARLLAGQRGLIDALDALLASDTLPGPVPGGSFGPKSD